jgi:hypothetical protein
LQTFGTLQAEGDLKMSNEKLAMSNEECCSGEMIELRIIGAIRKLLKGRVNELLGDLEFLIPPIEFGSYSGGSVVSPVVMLASCERTEKERIIRQDAYSLTVTFCVPETPESELHCYAYAASVCKAIGENPTLGGVADRAVVIGKKYVPPKHPKCGEEWEVVISLRLTIEEMNNAG